MANAHDKSINCRFLAVLSLLECYPLYFPMFPRPDEAEAADRGLGGHCSSASGLPVAGLCRHGSSFGPGGQWWWWTDWRQADPELAASTTQHRTLYFHTVWPTAHRVWSYHSPALTGSVKSVHVRLLPSGRVRNPCVVRVPWGLVHVSVARGLFDGMKVLQMRSRATNGPRRELKDPVRIGVICGCRYVYTVVCSTARRPGDVSGDVVCAAVAHCGTMRVFCAILWQ